MLDLQYVVASSPRTGSYLLCEGLEATGIAGRPTEVFSPDFQYLWRRQWGLADNCDPADYLRTALRYGTTPNGVYGLKIHWMHLPELARTAETFGDGESALQGLFPAARYVHITRRDRRAQALSYFRAVETNEWWKIDGVANHQRNGRTPIFDAAQVLAMERGLLAQDQAWKRYFQGRQCRLLVIEYELLTENYRSEIARVLEFLGLNPAAAEGIPQPRLVRQSDEITREWRRQMNTAEMSKGLSL